MIRLALYRKEMKGSFKLMLVLAGVISLYVCVIVGMYDPELVGILNRFYEAMPEWMDAAGMKPGASDLMGFLISYLYGMILLVFPMLFSILRANGLVAKYVDRGSMGALLTAPVRRGKIASTQMWVLISGIVLLVAYITALEYVAAEVIFPGELDWQALLRVNGGLLCLQLLIGSICFFFSCLCSEVKWSLTFGAGIPVVMLLLQMLANMGGQAECARYFTFFTLFDPAAIGAHRPGAYLGMGILLLEAAALYGLAIAVFCRKDLSI